MASNVLVKRNSAEKVYMDIILLYYTYNLKVMNFKKNVYLMNYCHLSISIVRVNAMRNIQIYYILLLITDFEK